MRYAGTALLCVVAAFGAAFLVTRAVDHGTASPRGTVAADTRAASSDPSPATTGHTEDAVAVHGRTRGLAAEFAPGVQRIMRKRPKPKRPKHHTASHSSGSSAPTDSTSTPTYTTSTPTDTPTTTESAPSTGSSGGGGAGSGTGTTSIGHSGKGSGTTTIG